MNMSEAHFIYLVEEDDWDTHVIHGIFTDPNDAIGHMNSPSFDRRVSGSNVSVVKYRTNVNIMDYGTETIAARSDNDYDLAVF